MNRHLWFHDNIENWLSVAGGVFAAALKIKLKFRFEKHYLARNTIDVNDVEKKCELDHKAEKFARQNIWIIISIPIHVVVCENSNNNDDIEKDDESEPHCHRSLE